MDALNRLLSAAHAILHRFASSEAVYRRGGEVAALVGVAWGRSEWQELAPNMAMVTSEVRDALIRDYESLLTAIGEPRPGDAIEADGQVFEAVAIGDEPCYRFDGAARHVLRIHTRLVSEQ